MTSPAGKIKPHMILIAEDSHHDRAILKEAFSELEAAVNLTFVENGEELLDYLRNYSASSQQSPTEFPSLVLMDLNMPRMNGNEALKIVRASRRPTPTAATPS